jgi:WD40 repeat protein
MFQGIDMGDGDEFMCVLPWKGAIKEPIPPPHINKAAPEDNYKLQVAYGVRTEETRENVHFNYKGKVVYMTACLGVINDYQNSKQSFFGGGSVPMEAKNVAKDLKSHTDDVLCLNLSDDRKLACSGQIGQKPFVYIWDADTGEMKTRTRLEPGSRGVTSITFSNDSSQIACIDNTDDFNCIIFRVRDGKQTHKFSTGGLKKLDISWGKTPTGCDVICIAGQKQVKFIKANMKNFDNAKVSSGIIKAAYRTDYASCDFLEDGFCLVGTSKGKLYKLKHENMTYSFEKSIKAHKKSVNCIKVLDQVILTGSNDKKIIIWNLKFKKLYTFQTDGHIRAVDYLGNSLIYSTSKGKIAKRIVSIENGKAKAIEGVGKIMHHN